MKKGWLKGKDRFEKLAGACLIYNIKNVISKNNVLEVWYN